MERGPIREGLKRAFTLSMMSEILNFTGIS